jgi:hypothetical protein
MMESEIKKKELTPKATWNVASLRGSNFTAKYAENAWLQALKLLGWGIVLLLLAALKFRKRLD